MTKEYYELTVYAYYGNPNGDEEEIVQKLFTNLEGLESHLKNKWNIDKDSIFYDNFDENLSSNLHHYFRKAFRHKGTKTPFAFIEYHVRITSYDKEIKTLDLKFRQDKEKIEKKYMNVQEE